MQQIYYYDENVAEHAGRCRSGHTELVSMLAQDI
jgi:hypothetical protein